MKSKTKGWAGKGKGVGSLWLVTFCLKYFDFRRRLRKPSNHLLEYVLDEREYSNLHRTLNELREKSDEAAQVPPGPPQKTDYSQTIKKREERINQLAAAEKQNKESIANLKKIVKVSATIPCFPMFLTSPRKNQQR